MSAEGMPLAKESMLAAPLAAVVRCVLRYPVAVIAASVLLAVAAGAYSYAKLGYRTSRLDLLNPNTTHNRLWLEYLREFGNEDDAVVLVEGASRDQIAPVLREMEAALRREDRLFHAVLHEIDDSKIRAKGLHLCKTDELERIERFLGEAKPILDGDWARLKVGNVANGLMWRMQNEGPSATMLDGRPASTDSATAQLSKFSSNLLASLGAEHDKVDFWPGMPQSLSAADLTSNNSLYMPDGKMGFLLLRLAPGKDPFAPGSEATDALRELISHTMVKHPEVKIGLTGLPIMENDEMRSSKTSMAWATGLSLVGVLLILIAAFGGVRHAMLANVALVVAIAWSFGYATLVVGHLNILSVAFTVTLNGLGIDYGVYYAARYIQLRNQGRDRNASLIEAIRAVGPAIAIGSLTTAAGFFAAALTSFTGVVELGKIAGGGIILCAIAQLFLLPALICVADRPGKIRMPQMLEVHVWVRPILRLARPVLIATLIFTAVVAFGIKGLWYDHNLLNMQARGLESVDLQRRLLTDYGQSTWFALSIADSREELLARKAALDQMKGSVEKTVEIARLLPNNDDRKQPIIARIQRQLAALPERPPLINVDSMEELGKTLTQAQEAAVRDPAGAACVRQLEQLRMALRRRPADECYRLLSEFQQRMAGDLLSRLHLLRDVSNPEPLELSDLPPGLVQRFVGSSGKKYLLQIYGKGDIWDMAGLKRFVQDVRKVDPNVTGNPVQAYESSREIKRSYEQASIYALLVIVGVLILEFRSFRWMLMAALPTGIAIVQMFGIMGFLDLPLNAANMIALPILMGVGVDYALQVVYDYRQQQGRRYRMSPSTALAVLVDGLTTVVGFGSFMIASHQGLQSLGRVLTIGVSCCLFSSLVMLPAALTWATRNQKRSQENDAEDDLADAQRASASGSPPPDLLTDNSTDLSTGEMETADPETSRPIAPFFEDLLADDAASNPEQPTDTEDSSDAPDAGKITPRPRTDRQAAA